MCGHRPGREQRALRRYNDVEVLVLGVRRVRPHVALTADFIVGFPGEDEDEFQDTLSLVEEVAFAKLHVFPFSPRRGTLAARMAGQVGAGEKKIRSSELRGRGRGLRERFLSSQLGQVKQVLVEDDESGLTGNYIRVQVPGGKDGELRELALQREDVRECW